MATNYATWSTPIPGLKKPSTTTTGEFANQIPPQWTIVPDPPQVPSQPKAPPRPPTTQTPPPPVTTAPPPFVPGGEASCAEGACSGGHPGTPQAPPSFGTPTTNVQTPLAPVPTGPDMSELATMMAGLIPAQQSQAVYIGGGDDGQPLPSQADRAFRGRDPNVSQRGFGNYMDALRAGFWG